MHFCSWLSLYLLVSLWRMRLLKYSRSLWRRGPPHACRGCPVPFPARGKALLPCDSNNQMCRPRRTTLSNTKFSKSLWGPVTVPAGPEGLWMASWLCETLYFLKINVEAKERLPSFYLECQRRASPSVRTSRIFSKLIYKLGSGHCSQTWAQRVSQDFLSLRPPPKVATVLQGTDKEGYPPAWPTSEFSKSSIYSRYVWIIKERHGIYKKGSSRTSRDECYTVWDGKVQWMRSITRVDHRKISKFKAVETTQKKKTRGRGGI